MASDGMFAPVDTFSTAVSSDGLVLAIGRPSDNAGLGAAWVFKLNATAGNATWVQLGGKVVGTGAVGPAAQGTALALSSHGGMLALGGPNDNGLIGAAWLFQRVNGQWFQQGSKLVGSAAVGTPQQGTALALSGAGDRLVVGGPRDGGASGAVWVFTRSSAPAGGTVWLQQAKLVGSGVTGSAALQGASVAISADASTLAFGGKADGSYAGATWVFARSLSSPKTWVQQGKLVGTGASGAASQGASVALSFDGSLLAIGAPSDSLSAGAAWVFKRSAAGVWSQNGNKLVGAGASGSAVFQGTSLSLSGDGCWLAVGGSFDAKGVGATWVWRHDGC